MAVYTDVSAEDVGAFLQGYALGTYVSHKGITQGVENTNYHLHTSTGRYILTIFEKRIRREDLPFVFGFVDHLKTSGITVPDTYKNNQGEWVDTLAGKPASIIRYLEGADVKDADITPAMCAQLGGVLAHMHKAAATYGGTRENPVGTAQWISLLEAAIPETDWLDTATKQMMDETIAAYKALDVSALPAGAVHADLFPDNVFFEDGTFKGVIDFYFACTAPFVYDLAIVLNAWCFEPDGTAVPARVDAFSKAYESVRKLEEAERAAFAVVRRAAALRFIATRLYDWVFTPAGADVVKKDPREYINKMEAEITWP